MKLVEIVEDGRNVWRLLIVVVDDDEKKYLVEVRIVRLLYPSESLRYALYSMLFFTLLMIV